MKLEVGMYVRTEYGISKIVNCLVDKKGTFIATDNELGNCSMSIGGKIYKGIYIFEEDYKNFINNHIKENIIDLIQVGDYVNGYKVYYCYCADEDMTGLFIDTEEKKRVWLDYSSQLKSIVTKEQFEAMAYKVV